MKRPELMVMSGALAGQRFVVGEGGIRLGRSSSNDIHIPDEELSRNHCLFEPVGEDGIRVTDLASANGTLVNGAALGEAVGRCIRKTDGFLWTTECPTG
jgi:pSer/pThr/pTyr-binding forkhead associated (FHA) protein